MKYAIFIVLMWFVSPCLGMTEIVNIGVYQNAKPRTMIFTSLTGGYELHGDGKYIKDLTASPITLRNVAGKVEVKGVGSYNRVYLKRKKWGSIFKIKSISPKNRSKVYHDNLLVKCVGTRLQPINQVYLEHYIGGVVESEAGAKETYEYYKVQSVICRTYALANLNRHAGQGFNLCDQVHCQVYNSKVRHSRDISKATRETKGIVIVDSEINLITAGFHSNCGGQTVNSEDVWSNEVSYLRSVCDTFCTSQPHASWQVEIPVDKWNSYFKRNHNIDSVSQETVDSFEQGSRKRYMPGSDSVIDLRVLRRDWQLRSTYFNVTKEDDLVVLNGNGFGHGVGLCQEGAMHMAEGGHTYSDILHYYYQNVHLIYLSALDFFKD